MSPIVYRHPELGRLVLFGTGGETLPGGLWVVHWDAAVDGDLSGAVAVVAPIGSHGVIAPPALADLSGDGILDIVVQAHDGRLIAIDGRSFEPLWECYETGTESNTQPAIGYLNADEVPDVVARRVTGRFPNWTSSSTIAVDGRTGRVLWRTDEPELAVGTAVLADFDGDGLDEAIFPSTSTIATSGQHGKTRMRMLDLSNPTPGVAELTSYPGVGVGHPRII